MSNSIKIIAGLALVSFAAACGGPREEPVTYTQPAPMVQPEPTYSKY
ncbi:hypothetical protein [Palleronia aestuarii]|nr:hypothetical protein [Palleronia aestuarii]